MEATERILLFKEIEGRFRDKSNGNSKNVSDGIRSLLSAKVAVEGSKEELVAFVGAAGAVLFQLPSQYQGDVKKEIRTLTGILQSLGKSEVLEVRRGVAQSFRNLYSKSSGLSETERSEGMQILLDLLQEPGNYSLESRDTLKLTHASLRGCIGILENPFKPQKNQLPSLLGLIKAYMGFGLPGFVPDLPSILAHSQHSNIPNIPSKIRSDSPRSQPLKKKRKAKPCKQKRNSGIVNASPDASDSSSNEFWGGWQSDRREGQESERDGGSGSETDSARWGPEEQRKFAGNIRRSCIELLEAALKKIGSQFGLQGFWLHFFPDPSPSYHASGSGNLGLPALLLKEPLYTNRVLVLKAIIAFLSTSRNLIESADNKSGGAFTSFAQVIASSVTDLHRNLNLAASAENRPVALIQILKLLSLLITITPYKRITQPLLRAICVRALGSILHSDINVRVAGLNLMSLCVITVSFDLEFLNRQDRNSQWLWNHCLNLSMDSSEKISVRFEAMNCLSTLTAEFPAIYCSNVKKAMAAIIHLTSESHNSEIRLHGLRLAKNILTAYYEQSELPEFTELLLSSSECKTLLRDHDSNPRLTAEIISILEFIPSSAISSTSRKIILDAVVRVLKESQDSRCRVESFCALATGNLSTSSDVFTYLREAFENSASKSMEDRMAASLTRSPFVSDSSKAKSLLEICHRKLEVTIGSKLSIIMLVTAVVENCEPVNTEEGVILALASKCLMLGLLSTDPKIVKQSVGGARVMVQKVPTARCVADALVTSVLDALRRTENEKKFESIHKDVAGFFEVFPILDAGPAPDVAFEVLRFSCAKLTDPKQHSPDFLSCFVHWLVRTEHWMLHKLRDAVGNLVEELDKMRPTNISEEFQVDIQLAQERLFQLSVSQPDAEGAEVATVLGSALVNISWDSGKLEHEPMQCEAKVLEHTC